MIKIYTTDVEKMNNENLYLSYYDKVSDYRKEKVDRLRFQKDKALSVAAETLLSIALENEGLSFSDIELEKRNNEKPYLKDVNLFFNLSHSGTKVMCAISDKEIGCDVELIDTKKDDIIKIAERYFYGKEYETIINSNDKLDMFYRLWTMKESFMKLTGLGMALPLSDFSIEFKKEKIYVNQNVDNNTYYIYELNKNDGYKYSFCTSLNEPYEEIEIKL